MTPGERERLLSRHRPRTVVTTDPELDDLNSMLRLVLYANEIDLRGLVYASSRFHSSGDPARGIPAKRWPGERQREHITRHTVLTSFWQQDSTFRDYLRPQWPGLELRDVATTIWGYGARDVVDPAEAPLLGASWMREHVSEVGPIGAAYRVWGDGRRMAAEFDAEDYFGERGRSAAELREAGFVVWTPVQEPGSWISEGDSSNLALLVDNGLDSWRHASWGGWGGRQERSVEDPAQHLADLAHDTREVAEGRETPGVRETSGVREPLSPVIAAMPRTRVALELQVTQEYTGHQRHVCYLAPAWREYLTFPLDGERTVAEIVAGAPGEGAGQARPSHPAGGIAAVSNVGDDEFWTGHPLAQANLYAFGRLAWDPTLEPDAVLEEWIALTFAGAGPAALPRIRAALHAVMAGSWLRYEGYTAPLGVGFMVTPGTHYGPSVDGYEYSPWGTYHFADRDGVGVDRTRATGTGYTGQYPAPWRDVYESRRTCPDELLLFFHHVPYDHVLHSGKTVIQHVYDSRADAVAELDDVDARWESLADLVGTAIPTALDTRVRERLAEQRRSAVEWRDQVRSYFFRKSGVPDATGRRIY